MHNFKEQLMQFDWSLKSIFKVAVGVVVIAIALSIVINVLKPVAQSVGIMPSTGYSKGSVAQNFVGDLLGGVGFDGATTNMAVGRGGAVADYAVAESAMYPPMPYDEGGDDAEEYERRNYNARYETRKFEETCTTIAGLKPLEYVVFDNSNKSEDWCSYNFRVDVEHEDDIIDILKGLDPKDFNIDTSTLERSIEYNDSELALQQRRLESLQGTLTQAESSFNGLIAQAERAGDTSTLSDVINNKINTLDRLNQDILNTQDRIDRLTRNQEGQVEQIEYAHFYTSVQKITFLDTEYLGDVWKQRVKEMFNEVNETFLALTVGLVTFVLNVIQFVVFATVLVISTAFVARVLWVIVKRIWGHKRRPPQT